VTNGGERQGGLEGKYDGYTVYDRDGDKIGKVDDIFVDEDDREEYVGVKTGLFGLSGTTMIPAEIISASEGDRALRVDVPKERIKDAPNYGDQDDIDAAYEDRVRQHFGLETTGTSSGRGSYGPYSDSGGADDRTGNDGRETGREESDEGRRGEDSGGYREGNAPTTGTSTGASTGAQTEDREGSGGEMERGGGGDREVSGAGYRDAEGGDQGEGMGLTSRRRRVRRRSLREENEEVFEEEETSGGPR